MRGNVPSDMCVYEESNHPAHPRSLTSLPWPYEESLKPWRTERILILCDDQPDLNLHWAHMFEGTFFDVATHI